MGNPLKASASVGGSSWEGWLHISCPALGLAVSCTAQTPTGARLQGVGTATARPHMKPSPTSQTPLPMARVLQEVMEEEGAQSGDLSPDGASERLPGGGGFY